MKQNPVFKLGIILISLIAGHTVSASRVKPCMRYQVFAGGVAGIQSLEAASNSMTFRSSGGGLYLHNSGWSKLTLAQRKRILAVFRHEPVGIELGFGASSNRASAWARAYRDNYLKLGVRPMFMDINAFANNHQPTLKQWLLYTAEIRKVGLPCHTHILPTFEYQNFRQNIRTLSKNVVSRQPLFQALIRAAGGLALDTPAGYFFSREPAYRHWVLNAIRWTRRQGLMSVVIVSPWVSKNSFAADTQHFFTYLKNHQAVPQIFVVENYNPHAPADYPNRVGSERRPNTVLNVARWLQSAKSNLLLNPRILSPCKRSNK